MVKQYVKLLSPLVTSLGKEVKVGAGILPGFLILFFLMGWNVSWGQTPYAMSGGNYSETFTNIANTTNWPNGLAASDAIEWSSVAAIGTGSSVTTGTRTTKSSATFVTSSTGGMQRGTAALQFLSTGSSATPEAVAVDLLLDFTGRTAGTLSFDWAAIDNASGTRPTSLRVFWSTDGTTFTEITAAQVLDKESATAPSTGSITTIALPTQFNNSATARLRFYNHAGSTAIGSGNRDKMQIDNIAVTSSSTSAPSLAISGTPTNFGTVCSNAPSTVTYTITNSGTVAAAGVQVISSGTNSGEYAVGNFTQNSTIAANGGTATYTVTFTPTATGTRTATITVSSSTSGSNSPTNNLTGTGSLPVTQVLTTEDPSGVGSTVATLNGNVSTLGVCPGSTTRGFAYSKTSDDSDPNVGDSNVTVSSVTAATGAYTLPLTGLPNGTAYVYRAYIYNGSTYTYGAIKSFTTTTPPVNDNCAGATALTIGSTNSAGTFAASSISYGSSRDVWYSFTPTCSGTHTININFPGNNSENIDFEVYASTCPSSTSGRLQLFGGDGPGLTPIANSTNGGDETADFQSATVGTTYYIRVIDVSDAATTFDITVTTSVSPSISLYDSTPMDFGNIAAGTNNVVLFDFILNPSNCNVPFTFSSADIFQINSDATTSDLSNFRLVVDANNNGIADTSEVSAAIGSASLTSGHLAFTSLGQTLTGGSTVHYLLIANVSSGAVNGRTFQVSLDETDVVASQAVSGSSVGDFLTITSTSISIADNAQVSAGNILRGVNGTVISKAKLTVGGQAATVTQMDFVTAGAAGGYVSSDITSGGFKLLRNTVDNIASATQVGSGVSSAKATATTTETLSFTTSQSLAIGDYYYWLTVDVPTTATPTHTIKVNGLTDTSVTSAGTTIIGSSSDAGIQTIISPTITIADNTVVSSGTLLVNTTDALIARAQLTASNSNVNLTDVNFVTAGSASGYTNSDIAANGFKLWYSTTNTFGSASLFGTAQASTKTVATNSETITFSASQSLTSGTPYYFWLTASISSGATPGKTITVNGLSNSSITSATSGAFLTGTSSASGTQTIVDNAPALGTAAASVDAPFSITLSPDNSNYRGSVTSVKIGATSLVFTTSAGNITLDPANASNTLLRTPGNKTIDITATNYTAAQVTQLMLVGSPAKLSVATQPTAPATNGGALAQQPVISILDQYNNATTSTQSVQATVGAGTWTLGGTASVSGVNGTATFTNLTATSGAAVTGATITFSLPNVSGATVLATSGTFNITAPSATQIVFVAPPTTGVTGSNLAQVRVEARTAGGTVDTNYTGTITISATGAGTLTGTTLSKAATSGVATFNDLKIDTAGSYTLKADSSTFTQATAPLTIVDPIAKWTFENVATTNTGATVTVTGSAVADAGLQTTGSLFSAVHASAATAWSNVAGNGSAKSVSSNTWAVGDYFQFKVNTTGYSSIKVIYDQTGSNTGPRDFKLQYSTTTGLNGTYTDFGTIYAIPQTAAPAAIGWSAGATSATSLSTLSFDLSAITALNGNSSVYFRVVDASTTSLQNTTVATGGTGRIDNFTVLGTSCPTLNAGSNGTLTICSGSTVTASQLFAQLGGSPQAGGSWSPTLAGAGTYTYTINAVSPCTGSAAATVTVIEQAQPNAGTNGTLTICSSSTLTTSQLFASLGGTPQAGGSWSPTLAGAGVYTYTVNATSPCTGNATATVMVTSQAAANAGTNGTLTICAGSTVTASQLFAQLGGSPQAGGSWSPTLAGAGTYTYTINAVSPCTTNATATVTVTSQAAPNAGSNGALTICSGTTVTASQLFAQLTGTPSAGGTWTPALAGAGVYTYTVLATSPCTTNATATVTVNAVSCQATQLSNCGNIPVLTSVNTRIYANNTVTAATKYRFRVAVSTAPTTYFYAETTYPSFRLTDVVGLTPTYGTTYNVDIQNEFLISGNTVTSAYGPMCSVTTQAVTNITVPTNQCGQTLAAINSKVYVNGVTGATMYTFRVAKQSAPTVYSYIDSPYSNFRLTNAPTSGTVAIEHSTVYLVAVSVTTSNGASNFNGECLITTPDGPVTTLQASQCGDDDTPYVVPTKSTKVYAADFVSGATYTFKLEQYDAQSNLVATKFATSPINYFDCNMFTGVNSLLPNTNYHVYVSINYYGQGPYDHDCVIKTPAALKQEEMAQGFTATAYPNPFANDFMVDVKSSSQSVVNVKVYDMIGRLIEQRDVKMSDLETTTLGANYPSGVYNVVVSQENSVETVRIIKR